MLAGTTLVLQEMCNFVYEQYSSIMGLYSCTVTPRCLYSQPSQQHIWHEQGAVWSQIDGMMQVTQMHIAQHCLCCLLLYL